MSAFVRPSCEGWRHLTWTHNVIEAGGKKRTAHMGPRRLVAIASHCISPLLSIQKLPSLHRPDTAQSWTGSALVFVHGCLESLPFESGRLSAEVSPVWGKLSCPVQGSTWPRLLLGKDELVSGCLVLEVSLVLLTCFSPTRCLMHLFDERISQKK